MTILFQLRENDGEQGTIILEVSNLLFRNFIIVFIKFSYYLGILLFTIRKINVYYLVVKISFS